MSALFVGSPARRIARIKVFLTFFPPHSETFRPFQCGGREEVWSVEPVLPSTGFHGAGSERSHNSVPTPPPAPWNFHPYRCLASARPLASVSGAFVERRFRYTG